MYKLTNIKKAYTGASSGISSINQNIDITVKSGRINSIQPHTNEQLSNIQTIDCSKYFVTPGLIDCHGHITILGLSEKHQSQMTSQAELLFIEKILHLSLVEGGVTTMRDIGGATDFMKRMIESEMMIGPRLKIAISMLSTTGGHADFRGPDRCHAEVQKTWGPVPGRPSMIVDGPWECRKRVREIIACGADLIKICTGGGIASPSDKLENRDFTAKEISAICDEATARGLRVAAHAHSRQGIKLAIENGVHDIQHISFMDKELVDLAYEKECTVTPTSWIIQSIPQAEGLSDFVINKAKQAAEHHAQAVEYAHSGGLKILGGTDPVLPGMHGRNYMELYSLIKDSVPILDAWYSMTGLAAKELNQDDTGILEVNKRADILIFSKDVINNPCLFDDDSNLVEVIKDGFGYRGHPNIPQKTFRQLSTKIWE